MDFYIIIPAHNEEAFLAQTLDSVLKQTLLPKKVIIVNDNSSDRTESIIDEFVACSSIFKKLNTLSSPEHLPGSKVVHAFNQGLEQLDNNYGFLVKLDADIILPDHYFERILETFQINPEVGIAGGFAYELDHNGKWQLNHPMNMDHVRGAFKTYSKSCFNAIKGLKAAMGWDTLDELLAQYHGFKIHTDKDLMVKHLRPTGKAYGKRASLMQGEAMYTMGYGFWLSAIASLKMAWKKGCPNVFFDNMNGYLKAQKERKNLLVSPKEKAFIRKLRWRNIRHKLLAIQ